MNPEENHPSFLQKYKLTLISLFVIVLAAIPLLLLSNTASKKPAPMAHEMTQSPTISPTAAPMTAQNAEPTLTTADTQIQNTMNQMDKDLQSVNQIDTSQDSTTGL